MALSWDLHSEYMNMKHKTIAGKQQNSFRPYDKQDNAQSVFLIYSNYNGLHHDALIASTTRFVREVAQCRPLGLDLCLLFIIIVETI